MKTSSLLPLVALALTGCDNFMTGVDLGDDVFSFRDPIVTHTSVECGDMLRDRLFFVDLAYRDAWPVRNDQLAAAGAVPPVEFLEVYIEDPAGTPMDLCSPDGTIAPGNHAVRMRSLRAAGFPGLHLRAGTGILELPEDFPLDRALALAWRATTLDGQAGLGRGAFSATTGDTLLLVRRPLEDGGVFAPLELLNVYDLGGRQVPDYRPNLQVIHGESGSACHEGMPLATLFYLEAPGNELPVCAADRCYTPFVDEEGWLWFPSLQPFSAGQDARPVRAGSGGTRGPALANTPHSGYWQPPELDDLGLLYRLRPGHADYDRLSSRYRIEVSL
jgi:hypothetical protein